MVQIRLILFLFCFSGSICWTNSLFAQVKYEREYRLKSDEVPIPARTFISACQFAGKIKWYREESASGASVEAKVKQQQVRYSIEFDTLGQIQDVEIKRHWESLVSAKQIAIQHILDQQFERYTFIKLQVQWTGRETTLQALIRGEETDSPYTTKYEIVLRGKDAEGVHGYEYLFDEQGKLEHRARIVFRNTDNLDY